MISTRVFLCAYSGRTIGVVVCQKMTITRSFVAAIPIMQHGGGGGGGDGGGGWPETTIEILLSKLRSGGQQIKLFDRD